MECELNPRIPYTELSHIIKKQKEVSTVFIGIMCVRIGRANACTPYLFKWKRRARSWFSPCFLGKIKSKCHHLLTVALGVIGPELAPQIFAFSDHQEVD